MPTIDQADEFGNVASSGSADGVNDPIGIGLGPAWRRFLTAGIYNGDFAMPCDDLTSQLDNVNNALPYWSYVVGSGTSIDTRIVADATTGSGFVLQMSLGAGAAGDTAYIEQIVPVIANADQAFAFMAAAYMKVPVTSSDVEGFIEHQYLQDDGATTTGSALTGHRSLGTGPALLGGVSVTPDTTYNLTAPADAYFLRVRIGIRRRSGGSNSAAATAQFTGAYLITAVPGLWAADLSSTGGSSPAVITQTAGVLSIKPDVYGTGAVQQVFLFGTGGLAIEWDGSNLTWPGGNDEKIGAPILGQLRVTNADFKVSGGIAATMNKAGAPVDGDFIAGAAAGGLVVDSTNSKLWGRTAGSWKGVAIAGLSVCKEERRCPRCLRLLVVGDELVPIINEYQTDRARHALYGHRAHRWRWRLARRLGLVADHTAWYTAAIRRVEGRWVERHQLRVVEEAA